MFTLNKIYALKFQNTLTNAFIELGLNTPILSLLSDYAKVILAVTTPTLNQTLYVDLKDLRSYFTDYAQDVPTLLANSTVVDLVWSTINPTNVVAKYVKYFNPAYNFKANACTIGIPINNVLPLEQKNDISFLTPNVLTNYSNMFKTCLISINGYLHRTAFDNTAFYAKDGNRTCSITGYSNFGIHNFADVGQIRIEPITDDMVLPQDQITDLYRKAYIRSKLTVTANQTILLSLGGYLVFPETNVLTRNADNRVVLSIENLPLLERIFDSARYIDLSSLGLPHTSYNRDVINLADLTTDAVIRKYLGLSQSFIIIVNTPNLFVANQPITPMCLGKFNLPMDADQNRPMLTSYGRIAEYIKSSSDMGGTVLSVSDGYLSNYVFSMMKYNVPNVTPNKTPFAPYALSRANMLTIGTLK